MKSAPEIFKNGLHFALSICPAGFSNSTKFACIRGAARLKFSGRLDILAARSVQKRGIVMPNMLISVRRSIVMLSVAYVLAQTPDRRVHGGAVIVEPPTTGARGVEWRI